MSARRGSSFAERGMTAWRAGVVTMPFVVFWWMLPGLGGLMIGNDYPQHSHWQQMELMFSARHGSFPLFVPDFWHGQSSAAMTLGQLFHPLSWLTSWMPGYGDGHALIWTTLLKLASLAVCHLLLFGLARRLGLAADLAFAISFAAVYNLRMLDAFRYNAALESYTGHLVVCAGIGYLALGASRWKARALTVAGVYWTLTSGHPQMAYYGLMSAVVFAGVFPFCVGARPRREEDVRLPPGRLWIEAAGCGVVAVALAMPYLLQFSIEFIRDNASRVGQDHAWALRWCDTPRGIVNSFFFPLRADVHGAFGGTPMFLVAVCAALWRILRGRAKWPIVGLLAVLGFALLFAMGDRSPVHYLAWKHLPLVAMFRVPGRVTLLLPMAFWLLLAATLRPGDGAQREAAGESRLAERLSRIVPVLVALSAVLAYTVLYRRWDLRIGAYAPIVMSDIPQWVEPFSWGAGLLALCFLAARLWRGKPGIVGGGMAVMLILSVMPVLRYGTWVVPAEASESLGSIADRHAAGRGLGCVGHGLESEVVSRQLANGGFTPELARVYGKWSTVSDLDGMYRALPEARRADVALVLSHTNDVPFPDGKSDALRADVRLRHYTFNRLEFEVTVSAPCLFNLHYPYSGRWEARVNDRPAHVRRSNGGEHAVAVPGAGRHTVEFRYRSRAVTVGMIIAGVTAGAFAIGWLSAFGRRRRATVALPLLAVCGLLWWWRSGLYEGRHLGWNCRWEGPNASDEERKDARSVL